MITKQSTMSAGFSLVEVLVAISMLLLVVVGPMQIIRQSSNSSQYATEQMIAYFLAQEGIELVQKRRDDLLLAYFQGQFASPPRNDSPMSQMLASPWSDCGSEPGCGIDARMVAPVRCNPGACLLRKSDGNVRDRYTHRLLGVSLTPTPYTRRILIERLPAASDPIQEFRVTSTVEWRTGSLTGGQRVRLVTYLANIYDTN